MHTLFFLSVHLPMATAIVSANSIHLLLKRCVTAKDLILTLGWLKSEPWLSGSGQGHVELHWADPYLHWADPYPSQGQASVLPESQTCSQPKWGTLREASLLSTQRGPSSPQDLFCPRSLTQHVKNGHRIFDLLGKYSCPTSASSQN